MEKLSSGFEIKSEQRQSWTSIAMVWAGGMICVPCLMIGGVLSSGGLSILEIVLSVLIGYGLICAYMLFIGVQAPGTGLPVSVMAEGALGKQGTRYVIRTILAIASFALGGVIYANYCRYAKSRGGEYKTLYETISAFYGKPIYAFMPIEAGGVNSMLPIDAAARLGRQMVTFTPVPTDALKYGKRVMVVGLKCFPLWRTKEGLALVGPRYFGVDTDYIPLEERCKGGL